MADWTLITQVATFASTRTIDHHPVERTPAQVLAVRGLLREGSVTFSIDGREAQPARLAEPVHAGARVVAIERPANLLSLANLAQRAYQTVAAVASSVAFFPAAVGAPAWVTSLWIAAAGSYLLRESLIPTLPDDGIGGVGPRVPGGTRNRLPVYEPVLQVLGRHQVFPDQAAETYVEVVGRKLYQRILLTCGPGPIEFEDLRFGENPVFAEDTAIAYTGVMTGDGHFDSVEVEFRKGSSTDAPITLFSQNHVSDAIGVELTRELGWVVRRTPENVTHITVIVGYLSGLLFTNSKGRAQKATVRIKVEYRAADADPDDPWTSVGQVQTSALEERTLFDDRAWTVAEGQYDVRLKRVTQNAQNAGVVDRSHWHSLQCLRAGEAVLEEGISRIAIYARLTDRFASIIEDANVIATPVVKDWNGSTWVERTSSNPASMFRHVLQGASNLRAVADAKLDLVALQDWHDACETAGRTFAYVCRARETVLDQLRRICLAGRASFNIRDGKFSVVQDVEQSTPVAHLTPRNSYGLTSDRAFPKIPDGFEVPFVDPESGWKEVRRRVVRPGVSEGSAVDFERLDMPGVTDDDQVQKEALYHLAVLVGRQERVRLGLDFEALELQRGDLVEVTSDVLQHGICAGRIKAVTVDGSGNATSIDVDETCEMEASKSYGVVIRKASGTPITRPVNLSVGANTTLTFTTPIPAAQPHPAVDDLFQFGLAGSETARYLVDSKDPRSDMGATLELLPEAPSVYTADEGTVPAFDPQITVTPDLPLRAPPPPRLSRVRPFVSRARASSGRGGGGAVEIVLDSGGTQSGGTGS